MPEFSTKFPLYASMISTLLALGTLLTYSRFMHLLANSTLLLTLAHGEFLLYTQKPMANVPFYTPYLIKLSETQNLLFLSNSP